jgi:hypothetical protein
LDIYDGAFHPGGSVIDTRPIFPSTGIMRHRFSSIALESLSAVNQAECRASRILQLSMTQCRLWLIQVVLEIPVELAHGSHPSGCGALNAHRHHHRSCLPRNLPHASADRSDGCSLIGE